MDETVKRLELLLGKAETDLDALSCKVDSEYKSLSNAPQPITQAPSRVVGSVKGLRKELADLASEVEGIQKQQQEAMSMVESQLKSLCGQFDELTGVVGHIEDQQQQEGKTSP